MKLPTPQHAINRFAIKLAAFSACLGILFVIVYMITKDIEVAMVGYLHLIPTVIVHLVVFIWVFFNAAIHRNELPEHFLTLVLMLLNIPLAIACRSIVLNYLWS